MLHALKRLKADGAILRCLHENLLRFDSRWRLNLIKYHPIEHFVRPSVLLNDASRSEYNATSARIFAGLVDDSTSTLFLIWYDH